MFEREEKELMELGEKINNTTKPDSIDEYIKKGIEEGQMKKKRMRAKKLANIVAFVTLITSIRVSPAIAVVLSKVPGLEYIVNLINYDKGIKDIVDNNFVQPINLSEEHEDLVFSIKDIIIDSSKCIVFYSIENKGNHRFVNLNEMKFTDELGEGLKAAITWGSFIDKDMNIEKKLEGKVELNFGEETIIPDKLFIAVTLRESDEGNDSRDKQKILSSIWKFEIPVDKEKFEEMHKVYDINEKFEIEGQKISFKTLTITPTRIALEVEYDKNNSKKILGFDDLAILNEKGEEWARISNGVIGSSKDDYNETLYFQSNYFANPKELHIKGSSIRAVDKDKLEVIVDMDKNELIKAPDHRLTLKSISKGNEEITLEFSLITDKIMDEKHAYNVFSHEFKDGSGKVYNNKSSGTHAGESNEQGILYHISSEIKYKNPIYLKVYNYPERIKGEFDIKVKN
ncbi:hypothetical protein GCM10008905_10850 [Clostridium malenominatum]|uniref:DUF4179 domain-containing protein n=1 Tax=Clostridium malenominatum TaxID=1539 RepID=A0ABN1IU41_9CLOT